MTTASVPLTSTPPVAVSESASAKAKRRLTSKWASLAAVVIAVLWTLPTFGLAVTSIRPERQIKTTGWWTFFKDPQYTLDNYREVLSSTGSAGLGSYFVNSFVIVIPSVVIPICLAALAAYTKA